MPTSVSAVTDYAITYGKTAVPVYRHGATPLTGLRSIPESPLTGRDNALFAARVTVEVFGDNFLPSYTEGDNSMVVATDSIKNLVLRESASWTGATLESLLHHLGGLLLGGYPQMQSLRMHGEEVRFDPGRLAGGAARARAGRPLRGRHAAGARGRRACGSPTSPAPAGRWTS